MKRAAIGLVCLGFVMSESRRECFRNGGHFYYQPTCTETQCQVTCGYYHILEFQCDSSFDLNQACTDVLCNAVYNGSLISTQTIPWCDCKLEDDRMSCQLFGGILPNGLPDLFELELKGNEKERLDIALRDGEFSGYQALRYLRFDYCRITKLSASMFGDTADQFETLSVFRSTVLDPVLTNLPLFPKLKKLQLDFCSLTRFDVRWISHLPSLTFLSLKDNQLTEFSGACEIGDQLKVERLGIASIFGVPPLDIRNMRSLRFLDATFFQAETLEARHLPSFQNLLGLNFGFGNVLHFGRDVIYDAFDLSGFNKDSIQRKYDSVSLYGKLQFSSISCSIQPQAVVVDVYCNCSSPAFKNAPHCPDVAPIACPSQTSKLLSPLQVCDGVQDCPVGEDEMNCNRSLILQSNPSCIEFALGLSSKMGPLFVCFQQMRMVIRNGQMEGIPLNVSGNVTCPSVRGVVTSLDSIEGTVGFGLFR